MTGRRGLKRPAALGSIVLAALLVAALTVAATAGTAQVHSKSARSDATALRKPGKLAVSAHVLFYRQGEPLHVVPQVRYWIRKATLRRLDAKKPQVAARFELRVAPTRPEGTGKPIFHAVRRSGFVPMLASTKNHAIATAQLGYRRIDVSPRKVRELRRAAAHGRIVITAHVHSILRVRKARGDIATRRGPRAHERRTFSLTAGAPGSGMGAEAIDNRTTGLLVWDNAAGMYAGPVNYVSEQHAHGRFYREDWQYSGAFNNWFAYLCYACDWPVGQVVESVGSSSSPALTVTESYNEHDTTTPRMSCHVQSGSGSGLDPICTTNQPSWPGYQDPPDIRDSGEALTPVEMDTWFVSAPGICNVAGVSCSPPATTPTTVTPSSPNDDLFAMKGIFVYDTDAHQFAGPIKRTGYSNGSGTEIDFSDYNGNVDKWTVQKSAVSWANHPQGWVEVSVGSATFGNPPRVPLKVKAIYNEEDQSKPRIDCQLDAASYSATAPTCLPHFETVKLYECYKDKSCTYDPKSNDSWFVKAPGICSVADVQCSSTPPVYSVQSDIYWTNRPANSIGHASSDGKGVNQSLITGANYPTGVASDGTHLYWANYWGNTIGRANIDGSGVNQSFVTGANGPTGVAVDGAHIYWANTGSNTIARADLGGSGVNQSFISAKNPHGVAVDGAHIYWANSAYNEIGRANLDGTGVNQGFILGASNPYGLTVDDTHVYWTNYGSKTIGRANLDGSGVNQSFISASDPLSVAVDSAHIFWTNYNSNAIGRANLEGTGVNQSLIGVSNPWGIVAVR